MRHLILAIAVCLLPGCAAPPDITVPGSDGQSRILIRCRDRQNCLIRAANYCPAGYTDGNEGHNAHELLIRCKDVAAE